MKTKFLLVVLSILLFTACQEQEKKRYFAESPEIDVLKAGIKAYETGDWDTWKSHFADTAKVFVNSDKSINVAKRLEDLSSGSTILSSYGFDHDKEYMEMVLDKDDETWVYYWAQWNGEFTTTKRKVSVPIHLAVQFIDGKIVTEHIYYDGTEMNKAIEEVTVIEEAVAQAEVEE